MQFHKLSSKVGVYMRVSSEQQKHDSQRLSIHRWLEANNIVVDQERWYVDKISGREWKRDALDRLNKDIFDGKITTVVIFCLDRLGRSMMEGLRVLSSWCERDVRVVSVQEQIDFSATIGRMVAALLLGLAEIDWERRRQRQKDGIEAAKKRGVVWGGNWRLKSKKLEDPRHEKITQAQIDLIIELYYGMDRKGKPSKRKVVRNKAKLARMFGLSRGSIYNVIEKYNPRPLCEDCGGCGKSMLFSSARPCETCKGEGKVPPVGKG